MDTVTVAPISSEVAENSAKEAEKTLMLARGIIITNGDQYARAGNELVSIKKWLKDLEVERKKITDPIQKAKDAVMAFFNTPKENATKAVSIIGTAMQEYDDRMEALVKAENAKYQAIADKRAKELEERAKKAAEAGNAEKAEKLRQEALLKAQVVPQVTVEKIKVAGMTEKTNYFGEVIEKDKLLFIQWCIKSENLHYITFSEKELKSTATSAKGTREIPGVRFWSETGKVGART